MIEEVCGTDRYSEDWLFYVLHSGRRDKIGETILRDMITKYCAAARDIRAEVSEKIQPHLWRHSRAMHLYQHGMCLAFVSQWLSHADLESSLTYTHADTEHKRTAIAKAAPANLPLFSKLNPERYTITDEEALKRLVGLCK